tara:strand:- start:2870 stop:3061 length:192 start_codon:yes stop_codon:yes gene_type:complete
VPEPRIKSREAAEYLGVSIHTLASWASKGKNLPFMKIGREREYRVSDLEYYVEKSIIRPVEKR